LLLVFAVTLIFLFKHSSKAEAGASHNVVGWLWCGSEDADMSSVDGLANGNETGVGWISMNSSNCDSNNDGRSDGIGSCPPAGTVMVNYGVNVPGASGDLNGYGWSENVGWISFNVGELGGCPPGNGACSARRSGNNIEGWARVMSIAQSGSAGGWEGWIKLNGVTIDGSGNIIGYAWSAENANDPLVANNYANGFGAIKFVANIRGTEQFLVCPDTATVFVGSPINLKARYWNNYLGIADCSSPGSSDVTASSSWSSSNSGVASVDNAGNKGRVLGVSLGTANIGASYNSLNAQSVVTVASVPCIQNCNVTSGDYCAGDNYKNKCGQDCTGIKDCGWKEVRP
jgi:hypothetical protein